MHVEDYVALLWPRFVLVDSLLKNVSLAFSGHFTTFSQNNFWLFVVCDGFKFAICG